MTMPVHSELQFLLSVSSGEKFSFPMPPELL